ncbi:MAG: acetyl-CoA carboxylase carboxyltransferase subunit alpha [Alphaproteobacteria bacterium]|nr:acetyl-CoA carboxylase carboxyltransferase subunit alpha [Alphaproteobacteria bacterium]
MKHHVSSGEGGASPTSRIADTETLPAATSTVGQRRRLSHERQQPRELSTHLAPLERVRLARDPNRPQTQDYIDGLLRDFFEIHGDRRFGDDGAIIAGMGYLGRAAVAIAGHQRGRSTAERLRRNFGKPHPEGYRKAARVFELAERFGLPLITFIDTQGAEPGVGAEERGQSEAIAANLELMSRMTVPIIACVIGEGGSGGALALGIGNRILMQENACYAVITPEGCAAILWREAGPEKVGEAAAALKLSAPDLLALGIIDEIVAEPPGGAQSDPSAAIATLGKAITLQLDRLQRLTPMALRRDRERKFAGIGAAFLTSAGPRQA